MNIKDNSSAVFSAVEKRIAGVLTELAPIIVSSAKRRCPVDTGRLRRSISSVVGKNKLTVGSRVLYAAYVEGGTPKMAAQPYLRTGLMENLRRIKAVFRGI